MRAMEPLASGIQLADENLGRRPARFLSEANYARFDAVRERYDPDGLFFARHGVGSERWSEDGFDHLA